jgi:hypothetical protein
MLSVYFLLFYAVKLVTSENDCSKLRGDWAEGAVCKMGLEGTGTTELTEDAKARSDPAKEGDFPECMQELKRKMILKGAPFLKNKNNERAKSFKSLDKEDDLSELTTELYEKSIY